MKNLTEAIKPVKIIFGKMSWKDRKPFVCAETHHKTQTCYAIYPIFNNDNSSVILQFYVRLQKKTKNKKQLKFKGLLTFIIIRGHFS